MGVTLVGDPLAKLALNIFCNPPDVEDLSAQQKCALHEFFHEVLAAGYRLYQIVPPKKAAEIMRKKFTIMLDVHDAGTPTSRSNSRRATRTRSLRG